MSHTFDDVNRDARAAAVGQRVQLHPANDLWMRGARYGVIRKYDPQKDVFVVKMDHPGVKKLVRVAPKNLLMPHRPGMAFGVAKNALPLTLRGVGVFSIKKSKRGTWGRLVLTEAATRVAGHTQHHGGEGVAGKAEKARRHDQHHVASQLAHAYDVQVEVFASQRGWEPWVVDLAGPHEHGKAGSKKEAGKGFARHGNAGGRRGRSTGAAANDLLSPVVYGRGSALGVGDTAEIGHFRIHRFSLSVSVTDITDAGKRGKKVEEFTVYGFNDEKRGEAISAVALALALRGASFARMEKNLSLAAADARMLIERRTLRAIDVRPRGAKLELQGAFLKVDADPTHVLIGYRADMSSLLSDYYLCGVREKRFVRPTYTWLVKHREQIKRWKFRELYEALKQEVGAHLDCH